MNTKSNLYAIIISLCINSMVLPECGGQPESESRPGYGPEEVREPAVSGAFYPSGPEKLEKDIKKYLGEADLEAAGEIRGLIVPHAGYVYSGKTAAYSYKSIEGKQYANVIIMGSNHRDRTFKGASIPDVKAYRTPLGLAELSPLAEELRKNSLFAPHRSAHIREHSIEVQLPFLQTVLEDVRFVPILLSGVNTKKIADALLPFIDDKTLIIASTDLSHYHPYETAVKKDRQTTDAIVRLDTAQMHLCEACGSEPVLVLMHMAKKLGWKAKLLDSRNSGDTAGDRSRVVGYCAVVFYEGKTNVPSKEARSDNYTELNSRQQKYLVDLARKTLEGFYEKDFPEPDEKTLDPRLPVPQACFVTLKKEGRLRGCIGNFLPESPLYKAVISNALSAALKDHRFGPVRRDEVKDITIEISLLSPIKELEFSSPDDLLKKLRPNIDGAILIQGRRRSTFLPQVWEQLPKKEIFLKRLCLKAGLASQAWKSADTVILTYTVQAFAEEE